MYSTHDTLVRIERLLRYTHSQMKGNVTCDEKDERDEKEVRKESEGWREGESVVGR